MAALALILLVITAIEIPIFIKITKRKNLNKFWSVAKLGLLFYLSNAVIIAGTLTLLNRNLLPPRLETLQTFGFFLGYGLIMFSPLFVPIIGLLAYYLTRRPA